MKCPGQDTQYWRAGAIFNVKCPQCKQDVEFFKDDTTRKCNRCGHRFVNPQMDFGCAAYCQFAEQCLGTLPEEVIAERTDLLKDRVAVEMKRHYKRDFEKIGRATRAARNAEVLAKARGISPAPVLMAAYLHQMTPDEAAKILAGVKAPEPVIEKVTGLIRDISRAERTASPELDILIDACREPGNNH